MFDWWKHDTSTAVDEPERHATEAITIQPDPLPIPKASPASPSLSDPEWEEYSRVAEAIGLSSFATTNEKMRRVLRDENIPVYPLIDVISFLDKKLGDKWEWRGLRDVDAKHLGGWFIHATDDHRRVNFSKEQYTQRVPLPVLFTVQKIAALVPEAYFYVSATEDDDPFLLVTAQQMGSFVVERWDEPAFRSTSHADGDEDVSE